MTKTLREAAAALLWLHDEAVFVSGDDDAEAVDTALSDLRVAIQRTPKPRWMIVETIGNEIISQQDVNERKLLAAMREITFAAESAANLRGLTDLLPYVERAKATIATFENQALETRFEREAAEAGDKVED